MKPRGDGGLDKGQVESSKGRYKRPFDLMVLTVSHIVLAPVLLVLWTVIPLLVWLEDRGPVFYKQRRVGKKGQELTVLKFRTMVPGADRRGPAWTLEGDPRVTRIGKFLRKTALDELPQILSIWSGDLSLVGPRALPVEEQRFLETKIPGFEARLRARPGLTGLAQVYDREDEAEIKLRHDLQYMDRMSPYLDAKLLALSVWNSLLARWDRRGGKERR